MFTTKFFAGLLLLLALGYMAVACTTTAPMGYDAASEQRSADQLQWQDEPWR